MHPQESTTVRDGAIPSAQSQGPARRRWRVSGRGLRCIDVERRCESCDRPGEELQSRVVWSYSHSSLAMERDAKVILGHRPSTGVLSGV
jgi:hypothetical protein